MEQLFVPFIENIENCPEFSRLDYSGKQRFLQLLISKFGHCAYRSEAFTEKALHAIMIREQGVFEEECKGECKEECKAD